MKNSARKLFLLSLCFGFFLGACQKKQASDQVCYQKKCFNAEIADNDVLRQRGLQDRDVLLPSQGMLFVFQESRNHSFWMKDTKIPLDMIWLDESRRVVHLAENVPPCKVDPCLSYTPLKPALYVFEVNAGVAKKNGIKVGGQFEFRLERYLGK